MTTEFGPLITAMATPFTSENEVDMYTAMELVEYLIENQTNTVLLTGTTGESPTLTHDEEFKLMEEVVKGTRKRVPIMAGTGSNCTQTAITSSQRAESLGVDALLQVVPYYNKPNQEGMYQHFKAVAASVSLPIMLYNIPGRTGINMEPETVARLAEIPNIVSIKEAAGDMDQFEKMVSLTPDDFSVYVGDDSLVLDAISRGGAGVVSVASHVVGKPLQNLMQAALNNDLEAAQVEFDRLKPLFDVLFIDTNPVPVKHALKLLGFPMGEPRLPLVSLEADKADTVESVLDQVLGT